MREAKHLHEITVSTRAPVSIAVTNWGPGHYTLVGLFGFFGQFLLQRACQSAVAQIDSRMRNKTGLADNPFRSE